MPEGFSVLNLFLVLASAWACGNLATRLGYPAVLGEIAIGILLGPPLLGLVHGSQALSIFADLGVLLLMLYIGLEIDLRDLGKASKAGLLAALGGFVVPFLLGYVIVMQFGGTPVAALFVGMGMGVTSLATKSRILLDLGLLDTRIAHVMMAGALVTDTLALLIFAGIISVVTAGALDLIGFGLILVKVLLFFLATWGLGLRVIPLLYRSLRRRQLTGRTFNATLVLIIALGFAELAHLAGMHSILGAFIAGLFLREAIEERRLSFELTGLVRDVSLGFLAPVFFVTAGFQVSFGVFSSDLSLLMTILVAATVGKILGTLLFYLPSGYGWREGLVIGLGMNDRGAVEIIIAGVALQAGIIEQNIFSILVFTAIGTTATVPILLKWGAGWLRSRGELVRSSGRDGVVIVGAGPLARLLAQELGPGVTLVDTNEHHCLTAQQMGLEALHGSALNPDTLRDAGIGTAKTLVTLTPNSETNVLAARQAQEAFLVPDIRVLLTREGDGDLYQLLETMKARPLFVNPVDLGVWDDLIVQGRVATRTYQVDDPGSSQEILSDAGQLPLVVVRGAGRSLLGALETLQAGDQVLSLTRV